jgi:hypothetical protein
VLRVFTVPEATLQSKKLIVKVLVRLLFTGCGEVTKYVITIVNELAILLRALMSTVTLVRSFFGDK